EKAEEIRGIAIQQLEALVEAARESERLQAELAEERAKAKAAEAEAAKKAEAEETKRRAEALEREHVEDIRRSPLDCIGLSAARLDIAIADLEQLTPEQVIKSPDILAQAMQVKADTLAKLQSMRTAQVDAEHARKVREDAERAERDAQAKREA